MHPRRPLEAGYPGSLSLVSIPKFDPRLLSNWTLAGRDISDPSHCRDRAGISSRNGKHGDLLSGDAINASLKRARAHKNVHRFVAA